MTTKENYDKLLEVLSKKFGFVEDKLHELVTGLVVPNPKTEVARLICHDVDDRIGIAFHVDLVPTDAIQIFNVAKETYPKLELFNIYYQDAKGLTYTGLDAQMMLEQDRQNKYFHAFAQQEKMKAQEDWEIKQLEKKGKITFH